MKFGNDRPLADPEKVAHRIMEIASTVEPAQDVRVYIELINGPFLFNHKGSPAEYGAGMKLALERGWLVMHESGSFVRFTPAGASCSPKPAVYRRMILPGPLRNHFRSSSLSHSN